MNKNIEHKHFNICCIKMMICFYIIYESLSVFKQDTSYISHASSAILDLPKRHAMLPYNLSTQKPSQLCSLIFERALCYPQCLKMLPTQASLQISSRATVFGSSILILALLFRPNHHKYFHSNIPLSQGIQVYTYTHTSPPNSPGAFSTLAHLFPQQCHKPETTS